MSESKKAGTNVFRVVDRRCNVHVVRADHMVTGGDGVTFHDSDSRGEVASFGHPTSVARVDKSSYVEAFDLTPGAVVSAFRSRWGCLDWLMFGALAVNAALMAYDQFGFAG